MLHRPCYHSELSSCLFLLLCIVRGIRINILIDNYAACCTAATSRLWLFVVVIILKFIAYIYLCVIEKDSTKSMIYGYRAESVIVDCYNEGDVSTGMRIRFTALGTVSNPILLNVDTEEFIQINATMKTGDVIEINTKYGSKGAKLIRDGVETDYFRYIDVDSTFMQLAIGDNMFRYDAASGVNSLEVSIFYSKEFLGV